MSNIEAIEPKTGQAKTKPVTTAHPETKVTVSFNFLKYIDTAGQEKEPTRWNPADLNQWIIDLNNIFTPRAISCLQKALRDGSR